jgi:hypothetical protein
MNPRALVVFAVAATATAQAQIDFQSQIWPILKSRCVECHATPSTGPDGKLSKPKGGVVLDSKDGITTSKRGRLAVANRPDDSLLFQSVTLPADDEDRMPPAKKGDPLTKAQTDLIQAWIEQGAQFGAWTGAAKAGTATKPAGNPGNPAKAAGEDPLPKLQKGLPPIAPAVLAPFAKGPFRVESIGDDSPLLRVAAAAEADQIDDAALELLLPIATHVTELDLGRTRITDAAGTVIAKMPRLTQLDVRQTTIGNHGIAALAACKELRSLNLFGTKAGDYGLAALATLTKLEHLYVWQTDVTAQAVVRLREALPGVRIVTMADLPEPMPAPAAGGRRR